MAEAKKTAQEFSTYKGRPLVRCGDEIYYGNMSEPYVIRLQVKSKNEVNGLQVADKVTVQLLATDPDLSPRKKTPMPDNELPESSQSAAVYNR